MKIGRSPAPACHAQEVLAKIKTAQQVNKNLHSLLSPSVGIHTCSLAPPPNSLETGKLKDDKSRLCHI